MNKRGALIFSYLSLALLGVFAQTPVSPPSAPFTNKVPNSSSWEVKFEAKDSPKPGEPLNPAPDQIEVAKSDKMRKEVTKWSDGKTSEIWYIGQYSLTQTVYRPDIYVHAKDHASVFLPSPVQSFDESDFPELNWLSLGCYDRLTSYQGHKCYHFQVKQKAMYEVPLLPNLPKKSFPSPMAGLTQEAWIDAETKLPRGFTDGKYLRTYSFKIGGVDQLEMPERFSKALQAYLDRAKNAR